MGTRSTIKFLRKKEGDKLVPLVNIYQQYDGYISGVGYELANFLLSKKFINGYNYNHENGKYANGFGCLIAQYIAEKKTGIGKLYIVEMDNLQEYNYQVIFNDDKYYNGDFEKENTSDELITIKVIDWDNKEIFEGTPSQLLEFKEQYDE